MNQKTTSQEQYERYLSFLQSDPNNIQLIADSASLAQEIGYHEAALELSDRGLSLEPNHLVLTSVKAISLLSLGQIDDALHLFLQLHFNDKNNPIIRYNIAYCLTLQSQQAQALPMLDDALAHYEHLPQMVHLQIRMLYDIEELEQAIELSKQVIELNPEDGKVHELLSSLYVDTNDFAEAQKHAALALQTNTNLALAHTSLGTAALSKQDDLTALQHFDKALQINQQNGRAWLGKAMTLMLQNNLAESERCFNAAIEYMPDHLGSYQALAWCQITQGNITTAEVTVRKALAIDVTFSENHGTLAVLAAIQGNLELAQTEAKIALKLDKTSFSGNYAQALIAQAQGNTQQAQQMIDTILDNPEIINHQSLRQFIAQHRQKKTLH